MPPQDTDSRLGRLEQSNETCSQDRRDLWDAHEKFRDWVTQIMDKQDKRIDTLESVRDTWNGIRIALWFIGAAFLGVLGMLAHIQSLLAGLK